MRNAAIIIVLLLIGLLLVGLAAPALANGSNGGRSEGHDHDRAREAVSRQDAQPLAAILPMVEARYHARMVEVDLESEDGHLAYEFELITPAGRIIEVTVDAATGDIVSDDTGGENGLKPED